MVINSDDSNSVQIQLRKVIAFNLRSEGKKPLFIRICTEQFNRLGVKAGYMFDGVKLLSIPFELEPVISVENVA